MNIDSKNSYSMFDFSKIFSFSVDMFANSDSGEGMKFQMVSMMKLKILMGRGAVRGCGKGCGQAYGAPRYFARDAQLGQVKFN